MATIYKIYLAKIEREWCDNKDMYLDLMELHQTKKRSEARDWITENTEFPTGSSGGYGFSSERRAIVVYKYVDGVQQPGVSLVRKANKKWPPQSKRKAQPVPQTT